tara:strand:+ start:3803 stop:4555 length:753 start_codon:yes stop_codon:yes gene_type:complete
MSKQGVVNIHGKQYKTVALRTDEFRQSNPIGDGWGMTSEIISNTGDVVIVKASITDPDGRVVATGHAEENRKGSRINKTSGLENAETSAFGRALAAAGLAGEEFCSADELTNALQQQKRQVSDKQFAAMGNEFVREAAPSPQPPVDEEREALREYYSGELDKPQPPTAQQPTGKLITEKQRKRMYAITKSCEDNGGPSPAAVKLYLHKTYNIESSKQVTMNIYEDVINWIQAYNDSVDPTDEPDDFIPTH